MAASPAISAAGLLSGTGVAGSPALRCATARPVSRRSRWSARAGAGSRRARSSRPISRPSASVPAGWASATPSPTSVTWAGSHPAAAGSHPATASASPGDSGQPSTPAATATGASQSSRSSSVPDEKTAACCHNPAVAITPVFASRAASGWTPPSGVCPAARSNSWKPVPAPGGTMPGRTPMRW